MLSTMPQHSDSYRARTDSITAKMNNVGQIPRKCKCVACGKQRTEVTGKHYADGFVCGMCLGRK